MSTWASSFSLRGVVSMGFLSDLVNGAVKSLGYEGSAGEYLGSHATPFATQWLSGFADGWVGITGEASEEQKARFEAVRVVGDVGSESVLEFEAPFTISGALWRVIDSGTGDTLKRGDSILVRHIQYSGEGDVVDSTWGEPEAELVTIGDDGLDILETVEGEQVGVRMLVTWPIRHGTKVLTLIDLFDVVALAPQEPTGPDPSPAVPGDLVQPAAPQPHSALVSELRELAALRDEGILTDEEFAEAKAQLLRRS
ncbi:SHOCT domain-containing protein [Demequina sp. SYSU T00068]|uniref:SHOCT domain-containing protein n=1 Tax=Demequina lignilytica TaxID=3051663 RepID=UPI002627F553|nr:SHOCT domain-containing protein [Demequina sp. SYSU T00068]MDN4489252.1 SHOCT domain-containing protein [Demequina sp. SYSU T00068]